MSEGDNTGMKAPKTFFDSHIENATQAVREAMERIAGNHDSLLASLGDWRLWAGVLLGESGPAGRTEDREARGRLSSIVRGAVARAEQAERRLVNERHASNNDIEGLNKLVRCWREWAGEALGTAAPLDFDGDIDARIALDQLIPPKLGPGAPSEREVREMLQAWCEWAGFALSCGAPTTRDEQRDARARLVRGIEVSDERIASLRTGMQLQIDGVHQALKDAGLTLVTCCEGGGPEDLAGTVALTLGRAREGGQGLIETYRQAAARAGENTRKIREQLDAAETQVARLEADLAGARTDASWAATHRRAAEEAQTEISKLRAQLAAVEAQCTALRGSADRTEDLRDVFVSIVAGYPVLLLHPALPADIAEAALQDRGVDGDMRAVLQLRAEIVEKLHPGDG